MDAQRRLKLLGIADALLIPIQRIIPAILPDFIEDRLTEPTVREEIVKAVDARLITVAPEAVILPEAFRQRLIRRVLDLVLDEILLPDPA